MAKNKKVKNTDSPKAKKQVSKGKKIAKGIGKVLLFLVLAVTVVALVISAIQAAVHAGKNHDKTAPGSDPLRTTISGKNWEDAGVNDKDYLPKTEYEYEYEQSVSQEDKKALEEDPLNNYKTKDYSK